MAIFDINCLAVTVFGVLILPPITFPIVFAYPLKLILVTTILSVPLGQLGRVPFVDPAIGLYISDISVTAFIFLGFFSSFFY